MTAFMTMVAKLSGERPPIDSFRRLHVGFRKHVS